MRAPAGSRSISSPRRPDGAVRRRRALLSEIPFARRIRVRSPAGPKPTSAPAAATIRSCRSRCRSRRRPAAGCWLRPGAHADEVRAGLAAGLIELCRLREASSVHVTFLPETGMAACSAHTAFCSATTSSSTGRMPATRPSTIFSARSRRASARRSGASGAMRCSTRHRGAVAHRHAT